MTRPVRVALDVRATRLGRGGVTRYMTELHAALRARSDVDVVAIGGGPRVARGARGRRRLVLGSDLWWHPVAARRAARGLGADVYHAPLPRGSLSRGAPPSVVTVHDLVALRWPGTMTPWNRLYSRATLGVVVRAADLVVAVSGYTAQGVVDELRVPAARIRVVHSGVSECFFQAAPPGAPRGGSGTQPYILFVGALEPRKNVPALLSAMRLLSARGRSEQLIVVSAEQWGGVAGEEYPGVTFTGPVDDVTLAGLYAGAECLALPSSDEGFGLPALEAMAVGTAVVVTRSGALPEVCGDAAIYARSAAPEAIAAAIEEAIATRDVLIPRGRARAARFRWDRCAEEMAGVYAELG